MKRAVVANLAIGWVAASLHAAVLPAGLSKARQLIDAKVKTKDRRDAGQIKDVLVDLPAGRIAYVILASVNSTEYLAIAPDFFTREDASGVSLNIDQARLELAPRFPKEQWPMIATDRRERLYHYYRLEPHPPELSHRPRPEGRLDMVGYGQLTPVSELLGMKLSSYESERLGALDELALNLRRGEIAYAVVALPARSSAIPKLVVLPSFLFQKHTDGKTLVVNTSPQRLAAAPRLNPKSWPEIAAPAWGARAMESAKSKP